MQRVLSFFQSYAEDVDSLSYEDAKKELVVCVEGSDVGKIKSILKKHPMLINDLVDLSTGRSIIIFAAVKNQVKVLQYLVTLNTIEINRRDYNGWTALHYAAYNGSYDCVKTLLTHKSIQIDIKTNVESNVYDLICGNIDSDVTQSEAIYDMIEHKEKASTQMKPLERKRSMRDSTVNDFELEDQSTENFSPENNPYKYDFSFYESDLQLCLDQQKHLLENHYTIGLFGESQSGKTTFIHNLIGRGKWSSNGIFAEKPIQYYAIEKYDLELEYSLHHENNRLWRYLESSPERLLESYIARWIYDHNFILSNSQSNSKNQSRDQYSSTTSSFLQPTSTQQQQQQSVKGISRKLQEKDIHLQPTLEKSALHFDDKNISFDEYEIKTSSISSSSKNQTILEHDEILNQQEYEKYLIIDKKDINHDLVKKYITQQFHIKQSKLFFTFYDFSGKHIYSNFINDFTFYPNCNIIFFNMEKLLSLTTRQETIQHLRKWVNYCLLMKYSQEKIIAEKKRQKHSLSPHSSVFSPSSATSKGNRFFGANDVNSPFQSTADASSSSIFQLTNYFGIIFIGTHPDLIPNRSDHLKISNLLYEKLNDLNIWNYVVTCPYSQHESSSSMTDPQDEHEKINLWYYPIDNLYTQHHPAASVPPATNESTTAQGEKKRKSVDDHLSSSPATTTTPKQDPSLRNLLIQLEDFFILQKLQFIERKQYLTEFSGNNGLGIIGGTQNNKYFNPFVYYMENISYLKLLKIIDSLKLEITNPFLTLATFQKFLIHQKLFSLSFLNLNPYQQHQQHQGKNTKTTIPKNSSSSASSSSSSLKSSNLFQLLELLKDQHIILWNAMPSLQDIIIINPLEYYFKPMNYIIYEHVSINTEILTELLPAHEFSKSHFPEDWQQMIKYGIISHQLLLSLLLSYQYYSKQLIYIFIKSGILVPVFIPNQREMDDDGIDAFRLSAFNDSRDNNDENDKDIDDQAQEQNNDEDSENEGRKRKISSRSRDESMEGGGGGGDVVEEISYYYLIPALFPLISDNKLFSSSFQPFHSNFSFYFYFELENHSSSSTASSISFGYENHRHQVDDFYYEKDLSYLALHGITNTSQKQLSQQPHPQSSSSSSVPPMILKDFLNWNELKKNGYLPNGFFEMFLIYLIYYSQQTSHDLTFKFSENISLLTPKVRQRHQQQRGATLLATAGESQYHHQQQHVIMYSYHHCFYKNQMILQFGNHKFRITNHLEYNSIQIEIENNHHQQQQQQRKSHGNDHDHDGYDEEEEDMQGVTAVFHYLQRKLSSFLELLQQRVPMYSNLSIFTLLLSQLNSNSSGNTAMKKGLLSPSRPRSQSSSLQPTPAAATKTSPGSSSPSPSPPPPPAGSPGSPGSRSNSRHSATSGLLLAASFNNTVNLGNSTNNNTNTSAASQSSAAAGTVFNKVNDFTIPNYKRKDIILFDFHLLASLANPQPQKSNNSNYSQQHARHLITSSTPSMIPWHSSNGSNNSLLLLSSDIHEKYHELLRFYKKRILSSLNSPNPLTSKKLFSSNGKNSFDIFLSFPDRLPKNHSNEASPPMSLPPVSPMYLLNSMQFQNQSFSLHEFTEGIIDRFSLYSFSDRNSGSSTSAPSKPLRVQSSQTALSLLPPAPSPSLAYSVNYQEIRSVQFIRWICSSYLFVPVISEELLQFISKESKISSSHPSSSSTISSSSMDCLEQFLFEIIVAIHCLQEKAKQTASKGIDHHRLKFIVPIVIGKIEENHRTIPVKLQQQQQQSHQSSAHIGRGLQFKFHECQEKKYLLQLSDSSSASLMNNLIATIIQKLNILLTKYSNLLQLAPITNPSLYTMKSIFEFLLSPSPSISPSSTSSPSMLIQNMKPGHSFVKEKLNSWQFMKPFDMLITFTMKTVERLLIEYREILLLLEDERDQLGRSFEEQKQSTSNPFQTPVRSSNASKRRDSRDDYFHKTYYYEQYLSPKKSPNKFYSFYLNRILAAKNSPAGAISSSSSSLSSRVKGNEQSEADDQQEAVPSTVFSSTSSASSSLMTMTRHERRIHLLLTTISTPSNSFFNHEESILLKEIAKYFQEISLIQFNHNYLMNYFLFTKQKFFPFFQSQSPTTTNMTMNQQDPVDLIALSKAYFSEIMQQQSSSILDPIPVKNARQILFDTIPEYYQRINEIYFSLTNYYEILLEICVFSHRSHLDEIKQTKKDQEEGLVDSKNEEELLLFEALYAFYLQFFEKKMIIQKILKEVLLIHSQDLSV